LGILESQFGNIRVSILKKSRGE